MFQNWEDATVHKKNITQINKNIPEILLEPRVLAPNFKHPNYRILNLCVQ
jgi:hypothetical protein